MSTPTVRLLDSAVGIVVLLLLAVAVVGGQSLTSSQVEYASAIQELSLSQIGASESLPVFGQDSDELQDFKSVDFVLPATQLIRELRLRNSDDDRPALLDD